MELLLGKNYIVDNRSYIRKVYNWRDSLDEVYKLRPQILSTSSVSLCESTPENIAGSLVIHTIMRELRTIYNKGNQNLPERLQYSAFRKYTDIPCYIKKEERLIQLPHCAPCVVMKYACGTPAGVITTGEYAGCIVTAIENSNVSTGVKIKRLYNDATIATTQPYSFTDEMYDIFTKRDTPVDIQADTFFFNYYKNVASSFVWHTEFLVALLTLLHIPIDTDSFVHTKLDTEASDALQAIYNQNNYNPEEVSDYYTILAQKNIT